MSFRTPHGLLAAFVCVALPALAPAQYTVETADTPPPKELAPAVRDALAPTSVRFLKGGTVLAELWVRKDVPCDAKGPQLKGGIAYRDVPETTLMGAVRFDKQVTDYRKQKIKPGVYTLRLGFQPMDGDHMGTAPYSEFFLICPAAEDKSTAPMKDAKELQDLSIKATGTSHPGVFLLFPAKDGGGAPKVRKSGSNWVLAWHMTASSKGETGTLPFGLTLVGASPAA
jgi:hypothetical protein